mgnify:CR=1 FL=1
MENENKLTKNFIIATFVTLYVMVSVISTIHVITFFELSNPKWLAITLALAFEVGAAASLASIIALKKMNKTIVWVLFFILTAMQAMGNAYFAYVNLKDYKEWIELFGLVDYEPIFQKRILSIVSGAILPLVALGFIKSLVDYIKPTEEIASKEISLEENVESMRKVVDSYDNLQEEIKDWDQTLMDGLEDENIEEAVENLEIEDTAENILGLTVEEESIEKPKAEYAKVIKNEDDLNEYLAKRSEAQNAAGLVRKAPEKRNIKTLDDDRPTGFNPAV